MNFTIEKPTKIIEVKTVPLQKKVQLKQNAAINFYEFNNDTFITPKKTLLSTEKVVDQESFVPTGTTATNNKEESNNSSITLDFLISSVKNDIRVKKYTNKSNSETVVFFYTLDDSISFYQQYSTLADMCFVNESNLKVFTDFVLNEKANQPNCYPTEIYKIRKTILENNTCDRKPFRDSVIEPENVVRSFATDVSLISSKVRAASALEDKKPVVKNSFDPVNNEEFQLRVNYFNKMKSMYSKNEIKKITAFIENDNFDCVLINIKELCVGSASNLTIQGMLKEVSNEKLCKIIKALGSDISAISSTKYGAYTIQTLVMACYTQEAQELVVKCFGSQGRFLLCHEIGNYTIQRILLFNEDYVYSLFINNLKEIIQNDLGMKVFKRCLELLKNKASLIREEITKHKEIIENEMYEELMTILAM